jgi:drug/metabolite transporter (DMT)-like permease
MTYIGELSALATSLFFSFTSIFFTLAGRRVGSMVVNRVRLAVAVVLLSAMHWWMFGIPLPLYVEPERWLWLGLSGIVGLALGDVFLFQAFVNIGPRLSMLMMSLAPVMATMQAWIFLGEIISTGQMAGILITLGGVTWVVMERNGNNNQKNRDYARGILYGLGGALGQATGLVLAKNGLFGDFSPISGNVIRMITAAVILWMTAFIERKAGDTVRTLLKDHRGMGFTIGGSFTGPLIGVSFSLLAVQRAEVGVVSTLMALPPLFLLPLSYAFFGERFGWGAVAGTFLAVFGVAVLFLV